MAFVGEPDEPNWAALWWGAAALLLAVVIAVAAELWRNAGRKASTLELSSARAFTVDALEPIASEISRMPAQTRAQRERHLIKIAANACASIPLALPEGVKLRVIVYKIVRNAAGVDELEALNHIGRKDKPGRIVDKPGTRGEHIFRAIRENRSVIEPDIDISTTPGVEAQGKKYKAFISCPIVAHDTAYGMISVDSPRVGSLDDNDVAVVDLMSSLLAIAFAEANRS